MSTSGATVLSWAEADLPHRGERVSGDAAVVEVWPQGALVAAIDALGHGPEAEEAARIASELLRKHASDPPESLLAQCHQALRKSRGAALTLASIDFGDGSLSWTGIGNVEAVLFRAIPGRSRRETPLLRGGIVGGQMPAPRVTRVELGVGDTLVMATDGIHSAFATIPDPSGPPQDLADRILREHGKRTDDALVLVARYLGGAP